MVPMAFLFLSYLGKLDSKKAMVKIHSLFCLEGVKNLRIMSCMSGF